MKTKIKPIHGRRKRYNPQLWIQTTYSVLVSYEDYSGYFDGEEYSLGWMTHELSLPIDSYSAEDARSKALRKMEAFLSEKYPDVSIDESSIEIKSVKELPQTVYMRRIGAPELFALAA